METNTEINQIRKRKLASPSEKHVLLVEDEPTVRKVHYFYLEDIGCTVDIAHNGKQALELYQPGKYDVVILDGGLPDTTGFELAKIIRTMEIPGQRQRLILLSAFYYEEVKKKCAEADIDDFAIKPVEIKTLEKMIFNSKGK